MKTGFACFTVILLGSASPVLHPGKAAGQSADRDWYWCQLVERPYGRTAFVSDVFAPAGGASEVEVEMAFEHHVQRRYLRTPVAGGLCLGPMASREEARRRRREALASLRRDGVTILRTDFGFIETSTGTASPFVRLDHDRRQRPVPGYER